MQFIFVLGAFAVIAVLMVIGIRQRWIPGSRGHWEPGARGRWEPGARGRWEPGAHPEPRPLPRAQWALAVVGWGVVLAGGFLGSLLRDSRVVLIALAAYGATWLARMILIGWTDATSWLLRVAAIARPLAIVTGIVLTSMTRSIWWFIVGALVFVGTPPATHFIHRLRRDRST
jgi:hypothetical protein